VRTHTIITKGDRVEAFLELLTDELDASGLGEFWQTYYTDDERIALAAQIVALAVGMVNLHKRFDEARNP